MKAAKLPTECLGETRRLISDLAIGETGYAWLTALIIAPNHDCFLDAKGTLEKPLLMQMTVRRDEAGFHVVLPSAPEFTPQPLLNGLEMLPIASITVSKDTWVPGKN